MILQGKKALITGAGGGIGQAIVKRLQREGSTVVGTDAEGVSVAADAIISGDLTDKAFTDTLPRHAAEAMGGLDILVNNAGVIRRGIVTDASDEDFSLSFAVNVEAPFRLCRAAIPIMAKVGGGAIVNMSSCWGLRPGPAHPIYVASKAALASLTQCLGRDHAHQGIRVNAVCPNEVDTSMLRTGFEIRGINPDTAIDDLGKTVPLGRVAQPDDIADVVLFLASDQARYMCGTLLEVNGGKPVG